MTEKPLKQTPPLGAGNADAPRSRHMTYTLQEDRVTLEMDRDDYDHLLLILGFAIGAVHDNNFFYRWLEFVNDLNRTNPYFTPNQIPPPSARSVRASSPTEHPDTPVSQEDL